MDKRPRIRPWLIAPFAAVLVSCSSIKELIEDPTAFDRFSVSGDYESVFNDIKSHALQCYQEKDYHQKTTIRSLAHPESKSAEVFVVMRGIDVTKYKMHISLKAVGPQETEVGVRDLYVQGASYRFEGIKKAAEAGSAPC